MTKLSATIVFFGSGPVAAASLRLLSQDFVIEAVVTKPRPAHHKGAVPVLDVADELEVPVYTVTDKASLDELVAGRPFQSRLAILIDFGIIVSQRVIDYFPLGIINSHFSLLPEWRGADPITFSILSGQEQTGVSLMLLTAGMDEGPLLAQTPFTIPPDMTTPELTEALITVSYDSLRRVVPLYLSGHAQALEQQIDADHRPTYSRRLTKDDGQLSWAKPAEQLEREVRAFADWPKSRCQINGLELIILKSHVVAASGQVGQTAIIDKQPVVYCGQDALVLDMVKPAGKGAMTASAFLAGYKKQFLGD